MLGDIPAIARDTETYGDFLEEGGLGPKAIEELGPVYQVSRPHGYPFPLVDSNFSCPT